MREPKGENEKDIELDLNKIRSTDDVKNDLDLCSTPQDNNET